MENILKLVPPFIRKLLITHQDGYDDRFLTVLGLRESGIPENMGKDICKKYWSVEKYNHAMIDENDSIRYLYNRNEQLFPNWETILKKGYKLTEEDLNFKFYKWFIMIELDIMCAIIVIGIIVMIYITFEG